MNFISTKIHQSECWLDIDERFAPHFTLQWPKSVTAISVCSRQFQFAHGNFSLLTAIPICSRQFQFAQGNFNFTYGNFNFTFGKFILLTAISQFYSRHFQFFHGNTHGIFFASLTTLSTTAADSGLAPKSKRKIKSRYLKSIFKEKSENHKSKVDLRTSLN